MHTPVSTVLNGCRETYDEVLFFCQEGKKYRKVNVWEKCFGDTEWVMDSEGDPVEMSDPEECAESTPPQLEEIIYKCENSSLNEYTRTWVWDNDLNQYTYSDVYVSTVGRCETLHN